MKKLAIYSKDYNNKDILLRTVRVTVDFIGIGRYGQINLSEFKRLASDFEPNMTHIQIFNM